MLSGIILDGGPSVRMNGEWKALLPFGGETIIQRQVKEMRIICAEVIVVTPQPRPFLRLLDADVRIITDFFPGKGPLGGMHAGFNLAKHPYAWVVGSHMPLPSAAAAELMFKRIADGFDAVVPKVHDNIYPLHGVYNKGCATDVLTVLERAEMRLTALLDELLWFDFPAAVFAEQEIGTQFVTGIYSWNDYRRALAWIRDSSAS